MLNVAVAHEDVFIGAKIGRVRTVGELTVAVAALLPTELIVEDFVFVCIGTDRSTGDALGPLVGTYLTGLGYTNVIGTIDDPTHAMNLAERVAKLPAGKTVIAIDACLGAVHNVGSMGVVRGSIKPGAGVGRTDLPDVGDYSINATVNVGGFMEYYVLQNTRLSLVIQLAKNITSAIVNVLPLDGKRPAIIAESTPKKKRGRPRKQAVFAQ